MPIYEFRCGSCGQINSIYQQGYSPIAHSCPDCGNNNLERIFSPFSMRKTDKQVCEEIRSDRKFEKALKRNDPKAIAEWVTRTSRGGNVPEECKETVGRLAKGEWPVKDGKLSDGK